jgi:DNA-binding transcriptional MerR regulator
VREAVVAVGGGDHVGDGVIVVEAAALEGRRTRRCSVRSMALELALHATAAQLETWCARGGSVHLTVDAAGPIPRFPDCSRIRSGSRGTRAYAGAPPQGSSSISSPGRKWALARWSLSSRSGHDRPGADTHGAARTAPADPPNRCSHSSYPCDCAFCQPSSCIEPASDPNPAQGTMRDPAEQEQGADVPRAQLTPLELDFKSRIAMPERFSIGELAGRAGVPSSTIRYYERIGLLPPPRRISGRRIYSPDALVPLALIRLGQAAGFTLGELLTLRGPEAAGIAGSDREALVRRRLLDVRARLQRLKKAEHLLLAALSCDCLDLAACPTSVRLMGSADRITPRRRGARPEPTEALRADA